MALCPSRTTKRCDYDYKRYLDSKIRKGNWFAKPRDYLAIFSCRESDLLLHLMNVGRPMQDRGWIPATVKFLRQGIGLDAAIQDQLIARLQSRGVLEVEYRGRVRYLRVDYDRVEELIAGQAYEC